MNFRKINLVQRKIQKFAQTQFLDLSVTNTFLSLLALWKLFLQITWSGHMIGDLLTTLVRCGEYNKGVEVMQKISAEPHIVLGSAPVDSLETLLDAAIGNDEASTGVVSYAIFFYPFTLGESRDYYRCHSSFLLSCWWWRQWSGLCTYTPTHDCLICHLFVFKKGTEKIYNSVLIKNFTTHLYTLMHSHTHTHVSLGYYYLYIYVLDLYSKLSSKWNIQNPFVNLLIQKGRPVLLPLYHNFIGNHLQY